MELESARRAVFSVWVVGQDERGIDAGKLDPALTKTQFGPDAGLLDHSRAIINHIQKFIADVGQFINLFYWLSML